MQATSVRVASACARLGVVSAPLPPSHQCNTQVLPPARPTGRLGSAVAATAAKRTAGGARGGAQRKAKKQLE